MNMKMFLQFADAVFGERGFPRLQILALGDFYNSGWNNILLRRHPAPRQVYPAFEFRVMHPEDMYLFNHIEKSQDFLGMCRLDSVNDESLALANIPRYHTHYHDNNGGSAGTCHAHRTQQGVEIIPNDRENVGVNVAHRKGRHQETSNAPKHQGRTEKKRAIGNER